MANPQFTSPLTAALVESTGHDLSLSSPNPSLVNTIELDSGWLSPKFCTYPQELVFEFSSHSVLNLVRLLSHSQCIASMIEIFIGEGSEPADAKFRRLGFMKLSDNAQSDYKARELKSVKVNARGNFVKFVIYKPHENVHNLCQQVGIVGVEFVGQYTGRKKEEAPFSAKSLSSSTAAAAAAGALSPSKMPPNPPMFLNPNVTAVLQPQPPSSGSDSSELMGRRIGAASSAKEAAVKNQDYVRAKAVKAVESKLKEGAARCDLLEHAKVEAVAAEDYDRASILKAEMDSIHQRAEGMMKGLGIVVPPKPKFVPPAPQPEPEPEPEEQVPETETEPSLTLREELEKDTMIGEDPLEWTNPENTQPSPRLKGLLDSAALESPRQKHERQEVENVTGTSLPPTTTADDGGEGDGRGPTTPPPPLDIKEAIEAKTFIDAQNSDQISPRVKSPPPEPDPPTPPVWEDEEAPREETPPSTAKEQEDVKPDGEEEKNEASEWEEAREIAQQRIKSQEQRQKEEAEVAAMGKEDEELQALYAGLRRAEVEEGAATKIQSCGRGMVARREVRKLRVQKQEEVVVKIQARARGMNSRSLVNRKRGVRKRTKNAFKLGVLMVKGMKGFKSVGAERRLREDMQEEEERDKTEAQAPPVVEEPPPPDVLDPLDTLIDDPEVLSRALRSSNVFGLENLQRVHSKDWALRVKGFKNIARDLLGDLSKAGVEGMLEQLAHVLTVGIEDKVSECMFESLNIIDSLEVVLKGGRDKRQRREEGKEGGDTSGEETTLVPRLTHDVFCPAFETVVRSLVSRLGDVNSGMSDAALNALGQLARWPEMGATFVAQVGLKRLFKWEELMARCVTNRLLLLRNLLEIAKETGGAGAGVLAAASLKFANDAGAFESTNESIAAAAKKLEEISLGMMGDNAGMLIGDLKGVSLLAELQRAERQRHVKLEKLCEQSKTKGMDLEHLAEAVDKVSTDVDESVARVDAEVDAVFDQMQEKLNTRRAEVKKMLKDIGGAKSAALGKQVGEIREMKKNMEETAKMARNALDMLHLEEYSAMIEPLTKHLEGLGDSYSTLQREACDDSSIAFVGGGREKVVAGIFEHFGAIHSSSDTLPGFQKLAGDVGDGRSPRKGTRKKPGKENKENEGPIAEGSNDDDEYDVLEKSKSIHLTVRALIPRIGDGVTNDEFHEENNGTKDTVVVEIRKGSERQAAKVGHAEILGRVIIVNSIEQPPRDDYKVEQYFESLYTQTEILDIPDGWAESDKKLIKKRRDPVTHRSVPTTRFTKVVRFQGESVWAQKLRREAKLNSIDGGMDWKAEISKVDEVLWK